MESSQLCSILARRRGAKDYVCGSLSRSEDHCTYRALLALDVRAHGLVRVGFGGVTSRTKQSSLHRQIGNPHFLPSPADPAAFLSLKRSESPPALEGDLCPPPGAYDEGLPAGLDSKSLIPLGKNFRILAWINRNRADIQYFRRRRFGNCRHRKNNEWDHKIDLSKSHSRNHHRSSNLLPFIF